MAGGLDTFLNFAIPIGIILWFGFIIYRGVKPQADAFFAWVKQSFQNMTEESNTTGYKSVIVYE